MKAVELNRTFECDDGIFNVKWWLERPKYKGILCEWTVLGGKKPCEELGKYWCVECGLVICKKHRKNHQFSQQHLQRNPTLKTISGHVEV